MDPENIDEKIRWKRELEKRAAVLATEYLWVLLFVVFQMPGRSFEFYCQAYAEERETLEKYFRQLLGYGYINIIFKGKELDIISATDSGKEFVKAVIRESSSS